jgi:RNA recognition motif-containing protein
VIFPFFLFGVFFLSKNIYVGNLAWGASDEDLQSLFSEFGEVRSARVILDRETGRSRGFGFVEMDDDDGALQAIEALNGNNFMGRDLRVNEAQPRERRPRY